MKELELLSLDGLTGWFGRTRHRFVLQPGQTCLNCDTVLEGRYCHACGQDAANHHRHFFHMIWDAIEGLFHLDGRLWRTLPPLFFRPGLLARDYMNGRLARHVPPFRTFLVALLLFIFVSESLTHKLAKETEHKAEEAAHSLKDPAKVQAYANTLMAEARKEYAEEVADAEKVRTSDLAAAENAAEKAEAQTDYEASVKEAKADYDAIASNPLAMARQALTNEAKGLSQMTGDAEGPGGTHIRVRPLSNDKKEADALKEKVVKALKNPEALMLTMFGWGHRLAVLLLPIMTVKLGLLYIYKRKFYLFDHFLVACNLLSFVFLTNAAVLAMPESAWPYGFGLLTVWTPVNIFMTLRGAYGSGIFGALMKTLFLWFMTTVSFCALLVLIFLVSVNAF